jgi:hypothetical protein
MIGGVLYNNQKLLKEKMENSPEQNIVKISIINKKEK